MAYVCELGSGQRVYLDNQGTQTAIAITSSSTRQQQQSSNSFQTGRWTSPPQLFQTSGGVVLKITTDEGEHFIQIQGNSMSVTRESPSLDRSQQMQVQQVAEMPQSSMSPMKPMEPMKPMQMGDMQMNINPMEMRMGDMEMRMGSRFTETQRFCSQCGASISPSDRFCSSCGHRLN